MTDLLSVEDIRVEYPGPGSRAPRAEVLHSVGLAVAAGETLGLVGESGSGKATFGRAVLGLVKPKSGRILFEGRDLPSLPQRERRTLASNIQVVFQDPYSSLKPSMTVGDMLT